MYGVSKEDTIKFMRHIVETKGNPSSKVARECNLEGFFLELCMRNIPNEVLVTRAEECLRRMQYEN